MELYLVKSAVILTILYGFYKLVLENESMHIFKRFYLLGSLPAAFLIPLITFKRYVEVPVTSASVFIDNSFTMPMPAEVSVNIWPYILWGLYGLGVVFFTIKFGKNLNQLLSKINNNPKFTRDSINHILLKTPVVPHTFLNYVFLNKQKFETNEIPDEVIAHEHVHAKQKHTIDILVVELLQIVFWFNPLLYFLKRSIKLNHEFLADRAILNRGTDTAFYQNLLLAFSSDATTPSLANSINYSFIKKRFTVMKKQTSTQAIWLRSLLLLPLLAILLYGFSTKEVLQNIVLIVPEQTENQQEKATKAEIEEYNRIAEKYNNMTNENKRVDSSEFGRINIIYSKMNVEQKRNAELFPAFPPPPPASNLPKVLNQPDKPPVPPTPVSNKKAWVKDFDNSFQQEKAPSQSKSIIFKINDDESFSINGIPSSLENYKPTLKSLITKFENLDNEDEIKVFLKSENFVKLSFINEIGEELKKYNIVTIQVTSGILDDRNEKIKITPPTPPVPPIALKPIFSHDPLKLAEEVHASGGELYWEDKKITYDDFKKKIEQMRTKKHSFCTTRDIGKNNVERLFLTIQE